MKKIIYSNFLMVFLTQIAFAGTLVDSVVYSDLPGWARDSLYSGVYLNIDQVMKVEGISRFEAIELQNQMRDLLETQVSKQESYDRALVEVKAKHFESGWKPVLFEKPGDFVAVLDLDETLLHQWYASGALGNFDLDGVLKDNNGNGGLISPTTVKFTPGVEQFIRSLESDSNCKGIAVFSAKLDQSALDLMKRWKFSDGSLARSHLAGFFSRNYLIIGPKVLTPSKDLRIFDPELKHVVILDDNPARIFQPQALKAEPKFDADAYFAANKSGNLDITKHYENLLPLAYQEFSETSKQANELNIPFTQALLPYSYSGERIYRSFLNIFHDTKLALKWTRLNPSLQEAVFHPAQ